MKIPVDEWKMWMEWKDHIEWVKSQEHLPEIMRNTSYTRAASMGGHTTYYPPIERTTLDNMVTLGGSEVKSWKKYQEHLAEQKIRVKKIMAKHKREMKQYGK